MADTPRIVGVSGWMRTGKDSVAALLVDFGYTRVSFADPLRKMAADIDPTIDLTNAPSDIHQEVNFGFPLTTYTTLLNAVGYERAKEVPDFRRFLQRLGTEGIRDNFGQDAWVNLFIAQIEAAPDDQKFVVPDVRFPNEAEMIKKIGGVVWRTERPGYGGGDHPSESMINEIVPNVILRAESLLDQNGEKGLGTLVLEQLGASTEDYDLRSWASKILG